MRPLEHGTAAAPQLCVGDLRHARLRPAPHAFAYPAYYLRLPLRALGEAGFGCALFSRNRFNLLSFRDRDHGDGHQTLVDWIDALLKAEGVTGADGEVWLQTMPRVLGFVFNPVSFWFCHSAGGGLRAVLCDVRNTFGERHLYLLDTGWEIDNGEELSARKVFHVSPFLRVEGRYRFRFTRLLRMKGAGAAAAAAEHTLARVDYDDEAGPVLRTSLSGTARPLTSAAVAAVFFKIPLMTLAVVVRIHLQALRLWRKRVPFTAKPPPPTTKVTR
ncbi:MAG: DUF1365 domain-containing protein [Massilia sp.]